MAVTAIGTATLERPAQVGERVKVWSPLPLVAMIGIVFAICGAWRWYQQVEGFKSGLDASEAAFWEMWMPLFYFNLAAAGIAQTAVPLYLWLTRDRALAKITPEIELKRYFLFFAMLITLTLTQTIGIVFGATDAAWHQVVVRDTSLTPSHIVLFFGIVPLFTTVGLGAFFFALTRIPEFSRSVSMALLLAVLAPFMVLPSVAYNEWGHAFWLMEELFIAPLHWGFVLLSWGFMASLGVIGQSLPRMAELVRVVSGPTPVR
ncbi:MAG: methane monooxygenase/ammonia monooxygenase subunit C [Candidatus Binatia bacterium]